MPRRVSVAGMCRRNREGAAIYRVALASAGVGQSRMKRWPARPRTDHGIAGAAGDDHRAYILERLWPIFLCNSSIRSGRMRPIIDHCRRTEGSDQQDRDAFTPQQFLRRRTEHSRPASGAGASPGSPSPPGYLTGHQRSRAAWTQGNFAVFQWRNRIKSKKPARLIIESGSTYRAAAAPKPPQSAKSGYSEKLLNKEELRDLLGLQSTRGVDELVRRRVVSAIRLGHRTVRFCPVALRLELERVTVRALS